MDAVTLSAAQTDARKKYAAHERGNIATRIFGGRMGTLTLAGLGTEQVTAELQTDFDAVRPIFANTDPAFSRAARLVAASAPATVADANNSAGSWTSGTKGGQTRIYLAGAPAAAERVAYTTTDWIPVASVPRTDTPGAKPLVTIRAVFAAGSGIPVYGNGTDDFTNWATRSDGRKWIARRQQVEAVNTPSNFTSTTNVSQSPIVGIQYLARGKVVTVMGVGDSITDGRSTYLGEGFILPAVEELTATDLAVEYANIGWSGQAMNTFAERAIDALESDVVRPDILVMPVGSPNDPGNSTITAAHLATWRSKRARLEAAARRAGVPVVLWTMLPVNTAVNNWGASDSIRRDYNTEQLARKGILIADTAAAVSGTVTGGQTQMTSESQSDGIHPNAAGNALLKAVVKPVIAEAIRHTLGNKPPASTRAAFPAFQVIDADAHVTQSGTWVYAATSNDGAWTLAAPAQGRPDGQLYVIKVRDTARKLVLSGGTFFYGALTPSTLTIQPGQTAVLVPAGSSWDVLFLSPTVTKRVTVQAGATYTLTREMALAVASGSTATWTLPAVAGHEGVEFLIKNRGSGDLTVQCAGTDKLYTTAQIDNVTVTPGSTLRLICDGVLWLVV
jgi:lysophospholipase L1-like esterase